MKWLNRFLIFLLIVLVAISIGLSIYYFLRNNETFSFDAEEGQSITKYVNIGEPFDITVIRNNPSKDSYSLKSMDESIVKFVEKVDENVFRFEAVSGGQTTIQLETTNTAYKNLNVTVFVGDGTEENPYFVRNYQDLSTIGTGTVDGRTLEANYRQVADIDMSVATTAWTPIGATSSTGFNGKYDGNGHTISNLNLLTEGSTYATESSKFVEGTVDNAGLFAQLGKNAVVSKLNITNAIIDCDYTRAGIVAGLNNGKINFVNVTNSIINTANTKQAPIYVGGLVGEMSNELSPNTQFNARLQYSSANAVQVISNINTQIIAGGLVGLVEGGMIYNSYSISSFNVSNFEVAIIGKLAGALNNYNKNDSTRCAVVNNYASGSFTVLNTEAIGSVGLLVGVNYNGETNTQPELKPTEENKWQNRILGNYCEEVASSTKISTIGGIEDVTDAYIALIVSTESMKVKPTVEQISNLNATGIADTSIAYVGYDAQGFFASWDFEKVWNIEPSVNNGYPYIRSEAVAIADIIYDEFGTRYIDSEEKLKAAFAQDIADGEYNDKYVISKNIYLMNEWTPIGTEQQPFNGQFIMTADENGNPTSIYNLVINKNYNEAGFFGYIGSEGTVQGLNINGVKITKGSQYVGAIAGVNKGIIADCTVKSNTDTQYVGINFDKDFENTLYVGGIVGAVSSNAQVQNSTASLNVIVNNTSNGAIYAGGIAGYSDSADITSCSYDGNKFDAGYSYEIKVNTSSAEQVVAGGIVGLIKSSSSVAKCNFTGSVSTSNIEGSVVGGLVGQVFIGYNADKYITKSSANNVVLSGYLVGGLAGEIKTTTKEFRAINICSVSGSINGTKVGGLAGSITNGVVTNCSTDCNLSGKTMAGFAVTISYDNSDTYGKVAYCFSNCSFVKSSGTAYAETESEVRATKFWIIDKTKIAGYVENCIYNSDRADGAERRYATTYGFWASEPDDGKTSENDCKQSNAFKNRGFDFTIWTFGTSENPRFPSLVMD